MLKGEAKLAQPIKWNVLRMTELHRQLGQVIRKVALSDEHFVVEKGGLPVAVMLSMSEYERLIKAWKRYNYEQLSFPLDEEL
jgi:prevent-host-death family protein